MALVTQTFGCRFKKCIVMHGRGEDMLPVRPFSESDGLPLVPALRHDREARISSFCPLSTVVYGGCQPESLVRMRCMQAPLAVRRGSVARALRREPRGVSSTALIESARNLCRPDRLPMLERTNGLMARAIGDAARAGDPCAGAAIAEMGRWVGQLDRPPSALS